MVHLPLVDRFYKKSRALLHTMLLQIKNIYQISRPVRLYQVYNRVKAMVKGNVAARRGPRRNACPGQHGMIKPDPPPARSATSLKVSNGVLGRDTPPAGTRPSHFAINTPGHAEPTRCPSRSAHHQSTGEPSKPPPPPGASLPRTVSSDPSSPCGPEPRSRSPDRLLRGRWCRLAWSPG